MRPVDDYACKNIGAEKQKMRSKNLLSELLGYRSHLSQYRSCVYRHSCTPVWHETIEVRVLKVTTCIVLMLMQSRS